MSVDPSLFPQGPRPQENQFVSEARREVFLRREMQRARRGQQKTILTGTGARGDAATSGMKSLLGR